MAKRNKSDRIIKNNYPEPKVDRGMNMFYNKVLKDGTLGPTLMTGNASNIPKGTLSFKDSKVKQGDLFDKSTGRVRPRKKDGSFDRSRLEIDVRSSGGKFI
jgi:hypothetical protein